MRRIILIAIALLSALSFAVAQTNDETKTTPKPTSTLEFTKTVVDLGEIPKGIPATAKYEFVNNGNKPVIITNVRTSCGCTGKKYPKEPIKPGEKGEVEATYNAKKDGKFHKTVTVTTDEGVQSQILRIKGKVVSKPEVK